ncbi:efflux RND transporter periplasmic adaptor subunit [Pseudomonas sp. Au-Pse12]|uniref:efflux RND transporter periplasmic adaptor subunit n=1 Tax=Pseudomonas sp. Au-Pse12 TaxID=2906459 RepID=UPI001E296EA3|nr:efflux RND transporter periplasmic adaptor subunit [Pseudomonas sp. Au-Pse12]MCE4055687.1 efflux RND transporter periplasmic adaptor subunit [Pseudomonas sp. Au-Pse12]
MNLIASTPEQRRAQRLRRLAKHTPRLLLVALLTLGGALLALWLPQTQLSPSHSQEPPALTVSSVLARPGNVGQRIFISGTLVPQEEIAVGTALQDQRLASIRVEEGDRVSAGQVLAELETTTLDAQVRQAEAALDRATALIRQQQALSVEARTSHQRLEQLGGIGAASAQQVDQQRAQARVTQAALAAARAEQAQARAQLADARAQRQKATLRAPVAGVVSERHARVGALSGSEPLFRLIRDNRLELDGEVTESALRALQVGTRVAVQVAGLATPVQGQVRLLAAKVDPASRRGRVRITLAAEPELRAGSFATSSLELPAQGLSLVLPQRALTFASDEQATVVVLDPEGKASLRQIRVGRRDGSQVEVLSGLVEGERVVARASAFVRDGDQVRPAEDEALEP